MKEALERLVQAWKELLCAVVGHSDVEGECLYCGSKRSDRRNWE